MNHILFRIFTPFVLVMSLAACATSATPTASETAVVVTPSAVPAEKPDDDLPKIPMSPQMFYDILVGELSLQRGQSDIAGKILSRVAQSSRDPRLAERATVASFHARQFDEARTSAQLWVDLRPKSVEAQEALAAIYLELDRSADAQGPLREILSIESARNQLDQGYLRVATVLGRQNNRTAATAGMRELVALHPDLAVAHLYAAHLAVRASDLDEAARETDLALTLQPEAEEAAVFRARIFISQKNTADARAFYETYLDRHPKASSVRSNFARFLVEQKQWDKAAAQFKRLLADSPNDADALYAVALLSLQNGQADDAERYLKRVVELRPDNDGARLYLGQIAEEDKRYDEAVRWYSAIDSDENYFEAQMRLALVTARSGDVDGARRLLARTEPENEQQRVQRALAEEQILREAKRDRDAFDVLSEVLSAIPGDKDLLYARALLAEKLDLLDTAEADLRNILKQDPKNASALNALGYTLADRTSRFSEAHELLKQAIEIKPDDPFILDSLGWVHYRLGNRVEAIKFLKRALEIKNEAEIAAHLGEVLWVDGEHNEAESVWNRALRAAPDDESLLGVIKKFKQ